MNRLHFRDMPLYRYGKFCTYDAVAVLLVGIYWILAHRSPLATIEALHAALRNADRELTWSTSSLQKSGSARA